MSNDIGTNQEPVRHVGDTRFEGWLSCHEPDRNQNRTPRYSKQDMRKAYWAGYWEASDAPAAPVAQPDGHIAISTADVTITTDDMGRVVMVSAQDDEGHVLKTIWEAPAAPVREPAAITDDDIIRVARETASAEPGHDGYILPVRFARAVLALRPAPAAPAPAGPSSTACDDQFRSDGGAA